MRFVENQLIFGIKSASSPCGICIRSYFNNCYLNNVNPALEAAGQIDFQRVVHLPALDNEVALPGPEWLAIDKLLAYFAPEQHEEKRLDREKAQQRYINHVREGVGLPSVWEVLTGHLWPCPMAVEKQGFDSPHPLQHLLPVALLYFLSSVQVEFYELLPLPLLVE